MMTEVNTFIIQPSINLLSQLLLTRIELCLQAGESSQTPRFSPHRSHVSKAQRRLWQQTVLLDYENKVRH